MAQLLQNLVQVYFDDDGAKLAGGKLYSYLAGTTTPAATYTDNGGLTANTNPVILDGNGQANVWIGSGSYKFVLTDPDDVVQWTRDDVATIDNGSITTIKLADGSVTVAKMDLSTLEPDDLPANCIDTLQIKNGAVTSAKIPDGELPVEKLEASAEVALVETSGPVYGDGPTVFPKVPFASPTLLAVPDDPVAGDGLGVAWSPNGKVLAVAQNNTDLLALFSRFGSELVNLGDIVKFLPFTGNGTCVAWSPDGQYLLFSADSTTTNVYQRQGNSYGGILTPAPGISGDVGGLAFCPNGRYFAIAHAVTPYISIIKLSNVSRAHCVVEYMSNSEQVITSSSLTTINFEDVGIDNMGAVTIGSSWKFVSQRKNTHYVNAHVTFGETQSGTNAGSVELYVYRNAVLWRVLDVEPIASAETVANVSVGGGCSIDLDANETIEIKIIQSAGADAPLSDDPKKTYISITEAGGYDQLSSFALLTDPGTLPTGTGKSVAWSPDGKFLAVGHATTPYVTIYERTGDTFAKCTDPADLPTGQVNGLSWSPDGLKLTCVHETTPFITTYSRASASATTFTKIADPADLPASTGNACAYNSTGDKLAVAHDDSPYVTIYSVDGSTFTKDDDPSALPAGNGKSVSWTPDGKFLTVGHVSSPYVSTYKTSSTFGSSAVLFVKEVNLV